jgi:hypothetical protein
MNFQLDYFKVQMLILSIFWNNLLKWYFIHFNHHENLWVFFCKISPLGNNKKGTNKFHNGFLGTKSTKFITILRKTLLNLPYLHCNWYIIRFKKHLLVFLTYSQIWLEVLLWKIANPPTSWNWKKKNQSQLPCAKFLMSFDINE